MVAGRFFFNLRALCNVGGTIYRERCKVSPNQKFSMKTEYKKISIGSRNFVLTISLLVSLIAMASGEAASGTVNVESLDGLQVSLVSPNVSGAEKLTTDDSKAHYYAGNDNDLVCHLNNLTAGTHRLTVKVTLGTNTYVLAVVDIVVAANADNETVEDSMNLTAVKSFGDGSGVPVPACYGVDENDNAHITTPLSVSGSVREGSRTAASGTNSHAEGDSTTASGDYSHAEGDRTTASGECSHAEGSGTAASGTSSHAEGDSTTASGDCSHAEGMGTIASQENQHVCGQYNVEDVDNSYQFIVGNGTYANRRNAFAVTKSGELALFKADGTPVILTPAMLEGLIALLPNS